MTTSAPPIRTTHRVATTSVIAGSILLLLLLALPLVAVVLRAHAVDALRVPELVGDSVPPALRATRR